MGFFDFLKKKKTDDERDLEEVTGKRKAMPVEAPVIPTMSLEDTRNEVTRLLLEGQKIYAVKYVKDNTGVSLKEAKDFVDSIEAIQQGQNQSQNPSGFVTTELEQKVKALLANGEKLQAIKLVKDSTGMGLKECKDYVERL